MGAWLIWPYKDFRMGLKNSFSMVKSVVFKCPLCLRSASSTNYARHVQTFHLLCPRCLRLSSKTRHPCFGAKLLSRSNLFQRREESISHHPSSISQHSNTTANGSDQNQDDATNGLILSSGIYIPLEIRADCICFLQACLAARHFLDHDLFTPSLFLLAKLQRTCIACTAGKDGKNSLYDFHSCRLGIDDFLAENFELTCLLFNITNNEKSHYFIRNFLYENCYN